MPIFIFYALVAAVCLTVTLIRDPNADARKAAVDALLWPLELLVFIIKEIKSFKE